MLWHRPAQPLNSPPAAPAPVPDTAAVRRAALQASWRRDRWVARRRLGLRWLLWVSGRYLLPALLILALGAWLWLGVLPGRGNTLGPHSGTPPAAFPTSQAEPEPVAPPSDSPPPPVQAMLLSPEGEELPTPLSLRFEPRWAAASGRTTVPATPTTETATSPHLKPDNWLHSKEP